MRDRSVVVALPGITSTTRPCVLVLGTVAAVIDTGVTAARVVSIKLRVDLDGSRSTYLLTLSDYGKTVVIDQP